MPRQGKSSENDVHALRSDARREKIIDLLEREGQVRVSQLAELLNTTTVTIRSDLDAMEHDGLVERVSGGAVFTMVSLYNREFMRRKRMNTEAKRAIAVAATEEVRDGDTLFINGGSTTYFAALHLKKTRKNLIVVTNSLSVATELGAAPTYTVILVGGQINSFYSFTCGTEALNQLSQYQVSKAVLSIDGIDENGIMTIHPEESAIAEIMIRRAQRRIILADGSKVGKTGFCTICDLSNVNALITDSSADSERIQAIRDKGVQVRITETIK